MPKYLSEEWHKEFQRVVSAPEIRVSHPVPPTRPKDQDSDIDSSRAR